MLGQPGKSETKIKCTEVAFAEFKDLLFATDPETGRSYFDATSYMKASKLSINIKNFFVQWRPQISALSAYHNIDSDIVCLINGEGHYLIEANFFCLFISFTDPGFLGYMCNRIYDLFMQGFCVSDTYLLQMASERLPLEVLRQMAGDEKRNQ